MRTFLDDWRHTVLAFLRVSREHTALCVQSQNQREKDRNATCIIRMMGPKTIIINPDTQEEKEFAFD